LPPPGQLDPPLWQGKTLPIIADFQHSILRVHPKPDRYMVCIGVLACVFQQLLVDAE
jgi:hypothetical protein